MVKNVIEQILYLFAYEWSLISAFSMVLVFRKQLLMLTESMLSLVNLLNHSLTAVLILLIEALGVLASYLGVEGGYLLSQICIRHILPCFILILAYLAKTLIERIIFRVKNSIRPTRKSIVVQKIITFLSSDNAKRFSVVRGVVLLQ